MTGATADAPPAAAAAPPRTPTRAGGRLLAGLSFRAKLLLALVGLVVVLLGVTLIVIRAATGQQVRLAVADALRSSREAFVRLEAARQPQLRSYGSRFAGSNRLPAAFDEAVNAGAVPFLLETTDYELKLAGIPRALAAYTDLDGNPVAAMEGGRVLPDPAAAVPAPLVAWVLDNAQPAFGYHLAGGRLFNVHAVTLALFGNAMGTLTLGLPVDNEVARQLAGTGDLCFVAGGRCVAASPGVGRGALRERMVGMAGQPAPRRTTWQGKRLALVADRVAAGAGMQDLWRVITVPLDPVLAPFERIQRVVLVVGIGALALAVLLGIVLSRGFARPVRALVKATGRIARGDYEVRVEVAGGDELGVLARSFNEMAHGLMLKEQYRGVLDKVVSRDIAEELLKGEIVLGGETRRVTTLFADVRGFTSLTEGMEPQQVIALLNEFMERASEAIDAEGGVVDKYVGDEVMALFGAPVARGDDAEAAVRAALRIRDAVAELNQERRARGEPAIGVGIGINSGPAVAGNMGSSGRLNYTVLGESVNVASRLCDVAGAGDIVATAAVLEEIGGHVDAVPLGARALKGLSADVELFSVRGLRPRPAPAAGPAGVATALLAALALLAAPASAQRLPTLEELGVAWTSADGAWQLTPSGRLELEGYLPGDAPPWLIPETDPFVGGRLSLLLDVFAGERVYGLLELRADRGEAPRDHGVEARVEQAFARVTPLKGRDLALQAGKFVSPFGGWPQRHHSAADPFIRPPLAYDYRTMVSSSVVPGSMAGFLDWKDDPATFRSVGAPPVWGAPYQVGAMLMGGWKGLAFRLAAMNSAPSSEPDEWNDPFAAEHGPSLVAHLGWQLSPELRLGASYDRGAYLRDDAEGAFPAGRGPEDYRQELWGFEAAFSRGAVEARAELLLDRWEAPNLADDPRDVSYYVETRIKLSPGLFAAARYGGIRFNEVGGEAWDYAADRLQVSAGYRLSRTTELRAEYMLNRTDAPPDASDDLFAVRWSWGF